MELLCNDISVKSLIILALSMTGCTQKNKIGIEVTIVTSIFEYDIIVYQYIHKVSNNFSSRCEVSDIYREMM
jgi:hypothetical protein